MKKKSMTRSFRSSFFLLILSIILLFMAMLLVVTYKDSLSLMEQDLFRNNNNLAVQTKGTFESVLQQQITINCYHSLDINVRAFMNSDIPVGYRNEIKEKISTLFQPHWYVHEYIYSMGVYAFGDNMLWSRENGNSTEMSIDDQGDNSLLEYISTLEPNTCSLYHHKSSNGYPYVLTVVNTNNEGTGAVFLSVNLKKLKSIFSDEAVNRYIIADDGIVLYSNNSYEIGQAAWEVQLLNGWKQESYTEEISLEKQKYLISNVKSDKYDWYYAVIQERSDLTISADRVRYFCVLAILCGCFGLLVAFISSSRASKPLKKILNLLDDKQNMTDSFSYYETMQIAQKLSSIISANKQLREEMKTTLEEFDSLQNKALQYQMNPHFLYNTLNTVSMYVAKELGPRHEAVGMILKLSQLLRYSLNTDDNLVTLKEEMSYAEQYLDIVIKRHQLEININWDIPDELMMGKVLRMALQPLIENAIYHGIQPAGGGIIEISARREQKDMVIVIADNGVGMTENEVKELNLSIQQSSIRSKHIGVANVNRRIQILFGENYGTTIQSLKEHGTMVEVKIPYFEDENGKA